MTDKTQSLAADVDKYYYYLNLITENVRNGYNFMVVKFCDLSLPLIPSLIEKSKLDFGEFDITNLPAIELGAKIWSFQGRRDKIDELAALVSKYPELAPWQIHIDLAYERLPEHEA
ncbi:MAG TPA: hypothetical protein PKC29_15150 [Thermodesulfobacteriota bacterium]|nr:hypothetical protein [Thermodesulfobacteriota bacterium]